MIRILAIAAASVLITGCQTTMMKTEPGPGQLRPGQKVMVDDGTCPSGQVKQITGGNKAAGVSRQTECVAMPAK